MARFRAGQGQGHHGRRAALDGHVAGRAHEPPITRPVTRWSRRCCRARTRSTRSRSSRAAWRSASPSSCRRTTATPIRSDYLKTRLAMMLGGRVAEEIDLRPDDDRRRQRHREGDRARAQDGLRVGHEQGTRADDLRQAGGAGLPRPRLGHQKDYSEHTAVEIDREIRRIIDDAYQKARQLLSDHICSAPRDRGTAARKRSPGRRRGRSGGSRVSRGTSRYLRRSLPPQVRPRVRTSKPAPKISKLRNRPPFPGCRPSPCWSSIWRVPLCARRARWKLANAARIR